MASAAIQPSAAAGGPWQALQSSMARQQELHRGSSQPQLENSLHSSRQPAVRQADPGHAATGSSSSQWVPSHAVQGAGAAPAQLQRHPSAAAPSTGHTAPPPAAGAGGLQGSTAALGASAPSLQNGLDSGSGACAHLETHPGALGQAGAAERSEAPTESAQHPATMVCSPAHPPGQVRRPQRPGAGRCPSQRVEAGSSLTDADVSWQSDHLQHCGETAHCSPGSPQTGLVDRLRAAQPLRERAGADAGHAAGLGADQPAWDQQHGASPVHQASQQQGQPGGRLAGAGAAAQQGGRAHCQPGRQQQAAGGSARHTGDAAWEQRPRPCITAQQIGEGGWQPSQQQQGHGTAAQKDGGADWDARRAAVEQEVAAWRQAAELQAAWELEVWRKEEEVGLITTGCKLLCT